jgi:hypothetical protein
MTTIPESGLGIPIIQSVFPMVRAIVWPGEVGIAMAQAFWQGQRTAVDSYDQITHAR